MQRKAPSHLAAPPKKTHRPALWLPAAALILAGALFVLSGGASAVLDRFSSAASNVSSAAPAASSAEADPSDEDQALMLAQAQAQADAAAAADAAASRPIVLDDVPGVTVDLIPLNEYSRPGVALEEINAIVIHYVGNPGTTAQQNRDYFASLAETGEESVSSHFVIGTDGAIIQCIPLDEKSYCTNHRNSDTISIECCHPDAEGEFTEETRAALVSLVRYLANSYALGYDDVIRHYDVTGKQCPKYYVLHEDAWTALKDEIFLSE